MIKNATYYDKYVSSRKCIFFVVCAGFIITRNLTIFFFKTRQKAWHFHWIRRRFKSLGQKTRLQASLSRHYVTQIFRPREAPQRSFRFDASHKHPYRNCRAAEHTCISLLPNFPRDKKHKGKKRPSRLWPPGSYVAPPLLDGNHASPIRRMDIM